MQPTAMLKSSCWLAATINILQRGVLTRKELEDIETWKRFQLSVPGELPPCLDCPDVCIAYCVSNDVVCEEFVAYQQSITGNYNANTICSESEMSV